MNLAELSKYNNNTYLNLSDQDYKQQQQQYNFETSGLRKEIKTCGGNGHAIMYLDNNNKIHLFEHTVIIKSSTPFYKNNNYKNNNNTVEHK